MYKAETEGSAILERRVVFKTYGNSLGLDLKLSLADVEHLEPMVGKREWHHAC